MTPLDLALVLDTTGAMGVPVAELRRRFGELEAALGGRASVARPSRTRIALACFKDHGEEGEDEHYLVRAQPFTRSWDEARAFLASPALALGRGGGGAEAVECALHAANALAWRPHSRKAIVLVGDKPPHGAGLDGFDSCPCGIDYRDEVELLARRGVRVHTIATGAPLLETKRVFEWISDVTGGTALEVRSIKSITDAIAALAPDVIAMDEIGARVAVAA